MENFKIQPKNSELEKQKGPEILKSLRINKALFGLGMITLALSAKAEDYESGNTEPTQRVVAEERGDSFSAYNDLENIPDGMARDIIKNMEGVQIVGVDKERGNIYEVISNQFIINDSGDPVFIDRRTGEIFEDKRQEGKRDLLKKLLKINIGLDKGAEEIKKIEEEKGLNFGNDSTEADLNTNEKQAEINVKDLSDVEKDYCILTKQLWEKSFEVTQLENREVKADSSKEKSEIIYQLQSAKIELREIREKHQELKNNPEIREDLKTGRVARDLAEKI